MDEESLINTADLETAIFSALGAASMCWSDIARAGQFDSSRATAIGNELLEYVRGYVR